MLKGEGTGPAAGIRGRDGGSPAPFVSVIVPTFERPRLLAECLGSLARTPYPRDRFEVIVVDDGGTASLAPTLAPFAGGMEIHLRRQPNGGPGAARNAGAERARGDLLAFIDDDCRARPQWLPALVGYHVEHPDRLIGGRVVNALVENPYAATSQFLIDLVVGRCNADPRRATFLTSNNMAVPAEAFRSAGGFDPSFRTAEDREFCDRWISRGGATTFLEEAVVEHANPLTLRTFWRQHFHYGRGASAYHRVRRERGSGDMGYSIGFHGDPRKWMLPALRGHRPGRGASLAGLLVVIEVANAMGFCAERLSPRAIRRRRAARGGPDPLSLPCSTEGLFRERKE